MSRSRPLTRFTSYATSCVPLLLALLALGAGSLGCNAEWLALPAKGSGDLAIGISGDPPVETTSKSVSTFPREDALTALSAAEAGLKACRRGGAVAIDATVEFAPSGKVQKLKVAPSTGPVAECVRADLTQIEIPRFVGPPVAMQMRVEL